MSSVVTGKETMAEKAKLHIGDSEIDLDVVVGTEQEKGINLGKLRQQTGFITLDEGYVNTGSTRSEITFLNGEQGILRYRGYPIEELATHCDFVEVCYLLIYGELPNKSELEQFNQSIRSHTLLHEDIRYFYRGFPRDAHPMATLSSVVSAMSSFYQDSLDPRDPEQVGISIYRLLAKLPKLNVLIYRVLDSIL